MSADGIAWLIGGLLAVGVGLTGYTTLGFILHLGTIRRRSRLLALAQSRQNATPPSEDEILGLDAIPWNGLYLLAGALGLTISLVIGPIMPMLQGLALLAPLSVWIAHRYLVRQRRRALAGQARQMLIDLRMLLTLRGSLLLALQDLAATPVNTSPIMRRLARAFQGGRPRSGLEVLECLAGELQSPHLEQAVQRLRAAQAGTLDMDQALATAITDIGEELNAQVEEQMQQIPTRMTFLAVPFLLGPIVILLLYPLADRILQTLAGK